MKTQSFAPLIVFATKQRKVLALDSYEQADYMPIYIEFF